MGAMQSRYWANDASSTPTSDPTAAIVSIRRLKNENENRRRRSKKWTLRQRFDESFDESFDKTAKENEASFIVDGVGGHQGEEEDLSSQNKGIGRQNNQSSNARAGRSSKNGNASTPDFTSASFSSAGNLGNAAISAPSAINESHIRVVRLRILLFEIGGEILQLEMEKCIKQKGFAGWKDWLAQHSGDVQKYQFFGQIRNKVLPNPDPSSWDITFLAFLSKCHALDFPSNKKRSADEIRRFRNTLSHDIKSSVDQNTFEDLWGSVSHCLLSLTDDKKAIEKEIELVKQLRVITGPNEHPRMQQNLSLQNLQLSDANLNSNCNCGGAHCDYDLDSDDGAANNNHEMHESSLHIRFSCWRCGTPRVYKLAISSSSSSGISLE